MDFSKNNTKVELEVFGEIELKYISFGDWEKYKNIIFNESNLSERDVVQQIIYVQLLNPKIDLDQFKEISDIDLIKISRAFLEKHRGYEFRDFNDTGNFFKDFIDAIKLSNDKRNEEIAKIFDPVIRSTQETLKAFYKDYGSVIQQVIGSSSNINKWFLGASKITEQIQAMQFSFAESLRPMIEGYQSFARIVESLRPQINLWQQWVEQHKYIFNNIGKFCADLEEEYKIAKGKTMTILKKYKWFIAPSMPIDMVFKIVKLSETKGRHDKEINDIFINYFFGNNWRNLEEMVAGWKTNPLLKKRMSILTDCVRTLKKTKGKNINLTNVILPTLIAQIDGFLTDYLKSKNISWDVDYDDLIRKNRTKIGRKSQFKKHKSVILDNQYDELANNVFLNILFQAAQKGKPLKTPFNFNRHKIMHGENVEYGRKDYLIRAFLVMDFLASLS